MIGAIITLLSAAPTGSPSGYFIGAVVSVFILGYLIYSLIKPEKF